MTETPESRGRQDYMEGKGIKDNPFHPFALGHDGWSTGWISENAYAWIHEAAIKEDRERAKETTDGNRL